MAHHEDAAYYLNRARQEELAASAASGPVASQIHRNLAERYRIRAWEIEEASKIRLVRD